MPLRLSKGRNKTCRRTLIRDLQISRAVKRRTTTRRRCRWTRRSATCDSAAQRINWSALFGIARERSLRIPMVVNDRYAKQSADRTHFYTFQSEGQFNCGGRSHTGICNILREQSSSRDRQCMRSHDSQWHLHLYWHGAQWDLEQRWMLKCICDRGLTTGLEFFRRRIGARTRGKWYARGRADNAAPARPATMLNENSMRLSFHVTDMPTSRTYLMVQMR